MARLVILETFGSGNGSTQKWFIDLLKNDYSNFEFEIKNSNIFYNNIKDDILFINKINKLKYYYDKKKFSNFIIAENEIFNISYFMKIQNNFENKKIKNSINSDLLKLKIKNQFSYENIELYLYPTFAFLVHYRWIWRSVHGYRQ